MGNWFKRIKEKSGAATVEAIVSFTGFLFVIITILNVANYCRAQMVISNAVDAAAREMGQYSYFYNMSGMKKFNDYVNENAGVGAANINDVIDGVNSVYTTMTTSLSDSSDYGAYLADKVDDQTLNFQDLQTAVMKVDTDANSILSSINAMEAKFSSVQRNPLLYMKSLAAAASGEAFDLAKSYAIAAPLAKVFTAANINSGKITVQEYLENLGIVNGFDGLNFNTSTIFTAGEPNDIHIRCYYKISLCNFVDKSLFDITVCKEAVCRAWLGGDDNPVKVSEQAGVPSPSGGDDTKNTPEVVDNDDADVSGGEGGGGKDGKDDGDVSDGDGGGGGKDPVVADVSDGDPGKPPVDENTAALMELVAELNVKGANADDAVNVYRWALELGIDVDSLGLRKADGTTWAESEMISVMAGKVHDNNSYKDMCSIIFNASDLSKEDKYKMLLDLYNSMGYKTDLYVPTSLDYVKSFNSDGSISYDWPSNLGFAPGTVTPLQPGGASLPDNWDRYGSSYGRNFSDLPGGDEKNKYSWDKRSLPYEENPDAYHHGTMNDKCYFDVIDALIKPGGTIKDVNDALAKEGLGPIDESAYWQAMKEYGDYATDVATTFKGKVNAPYGLTGSVAGAFGEPGGASQYTTPISIETMVMMGIVKYD